MFCLSIIFKCLLFGVFIKMVGRPGVKYIKLGPLEVSVTFYLHHRKYLPCSGSVYMKFVLCA